MVLRVRAERQSPSSLRRRHERGRWPRPRRGGFAAVVSLDLRRLERSSTSTRVGEATLGAGLTGPAAEALLAARGFELGHYPQSFRFATIGGFAATRSSGQNSAGYGRFDDMVRGLRVVTPTGTLDLGRAPASAAGPDLRQLFLGSEGTLGVITAVRVAVHPLPERERVRGVALPRLRHRLRRPPRGEQQRRRRHRAAALRRGRDRLNLASPSRSAEPRSPAAGWPDVRRNGRRGGARRGRDPGGVVGGRRHSLGAEPAQAWEHGRFDAPYLRDGLLANGALCETLETATSWSKLPELKAAVTEALQGALTATGTPSLVLCHVSHGYDTGASLYFTVSPVSAATRSSSGPGPSARPPTPSSAWARRSRITMPSAWTTGRG